LKEVNEKQIIKDRQLGDRKAQVDQLKEVNEKMREKLAVLDSKLAEQSTAIARLKLEKDKIDNTSQDYQKQLLTKGDKLKMNQSTLIEL
jgi:hypothetical protein